MKKETRVYVLSTDFTADDVCYDTLEYWRKFFQGNGTQLKEAEEFMLEAEKNGSVYTLDSFMDALNTDEVAIVNSFVYITEVEL